MKKQSSYILLGRHISAEYALGGLLSLCIKMVFSRFTTSANPQKIYSSDKKVHLLPSFLWFVRILFFAKIRLSVQHG